MAGTVRIGIDTGGTFTDVVALDEETGAVVTTKTPSTPAATPADANGWLYSACPAVTPSPAPSGCQPCAIICARSAASVVKRWFGAPLCPLLYRR